MRKVLKPMVLEREREREREREWGAFDFGSNQNNNSNQMHISYKTNQYAQKHIQFFRHSLLSSLFSLLSSIPKMRLLLFCSWHGCDARRHVTVQPNVFVKYFKIIDFNLLTVNHFIGLFFFNKTIIFL